MRAAPIPLLAALLAAGCEAGSGAPRPDERMRVHADLDGLRVDNASGQRFFECDWTLNGEYELRGNIGIDPKSVTAPWGAFVDGDGNRFDFPNRAPTTIHVHCREPSSLTLYRAWDR